MRNFLKAAVGIAGIGALISCIAQAVIIDNQYGDTVLVEIIDDNMIVHRQHFRIPKGGRKYVHHGRIFEIAVRNDNNVKDVESIEFVGGGRSTDFSTSMHYFLTPTILTPTIIDALKRKQDLVIKIIEDPRQKGRPLALLPEKEIKEFLLKEHQAKVKPLIQEAGKSLPESVYMSEDVANIAAGYASPEEEPTP